MSDPHDANHAALSPLGTALEEHGSSLGLSTDERVDHVMVAIADLHAKVDNLGAGLQAVYQGVSGLVKMLSAVQQVASMMPGPAGKIIRRMAKGSGGAVEESGEGNG
jgi:hypothetical protein